MKPLRRLLLLIPFALLGAALLVRSRLPHPQTEGDKWLWEQGETLTSLRIDYEVRGKVPETFQSLDIRDRQGIRNLLRAFRDTPSFHPVAEAEHVPNSSFVPLRFIFHAPNQMYLVWLPVRVIA